MKHERRGEQHGGGRREHEQRRGEQHAAVDERQAGCRRPRSEARDREASERARRGPDREHQAALVARSRGLERGGHGQLDAAERPADEQRTREHDPERRGADRQRTAAPRVCTVEHLAPQLAREHEASDDGDAGHHAERGHGSPERDEHGEHDGAEREQHLLRRRVERVESAALVGARVVGDACAGDRAGRWQRCAREQCRGQHREAPGVSGERRCPEQHAARDARDRDRPGGIRPLGKPRDQRSGGGEAEREGARGSACDRVREARVARREHEREPDHGRREACCEGGDEQAAGAAHSLARLITESSRIGSLTSSSGPCGASESSSRESPGLRW